MIELRLKKTDEETCLFMNDWLTVFFYVDDIVLLCRPADLPKLNEFKEALMNRYEMKDLGELTWFLGV